MAQPSVINICFSGAWGGLEMSTVKMTRLFHEAGFHSTAICRSDSPIEKALKTQGLAHHSFTPRDYFSPRSTWRIHKVLETIKPRAVFMHSTRDIWLITPALFGLPETKLIAFARMFVKDVSKKDFGHRLVYSRLNSMITLSKIQKSYLERLLPIPADRFVVIPNGVDTKRFSPRDRRDDIRAEWNVSPEHVLFGLIGRLDRLKGSMEFVNAAAQVLRSYPQARFVMVGGNTIGGEPEFDREVKTRIAELNLGSQVILTDFRSDIPDVMNALDVFVMPSYEENFANVMLEAMASGLPCIGTDSGGTPEILSYGDCGLLCQPQSSDSLAESMLTLLSNPQRRHALGQKAREKALTEYEMSSVFKRIIALV